MSGWQHGYTIILRQCGISVNSARRICGEEWVAETCAQWYYESRVDAGRKVNHARNRQSWRGRLDLLGSEQPIYNNPAKKFIPYQFLYQCTCFPFAVCRKRLDLAFLIDGSGSIEASGRGNYRRCLNFVKRLVASFHISPRRTRVGVVLFSSRAWLVFNFRRFKNKHSVLYAISRMRYPRGETRIGRALRFARYRLFPRRTNRRKVSVD